MILTSRARFSAARAGAKRLLPVAAAALAASAPGAPPAPGGSVLSPGPIAGNSIAMEQIRGDAFCEFEVIMGSPPDLVVEIYNTTGQGPCTPAEFGPIDAKALAKELGVVAVIKNPTRYWLVDRLWVYDTGETHDFDGVKATWMARLELKAAGLQEHGKPFAPYQPGQTKRNSKFEWSKGSEVYLLRSPDGHTWIMQAYTDLVDKSLTQADLPSLGKRLALPPGWKYEVKTLDRALTLAPPGPDHLAHAVADELQNMYAGCDFGTTCNYVP